MTRADARRWLAGLALALMYSGGCGDTGSAEPMSAPDAPVTRAVGPRPRPSVRVLRETAVRALSEDAMSRSFKGLTPKRIEGGIVKLNLEGRFQHASVAVIDERGETRAGCVDGNASASATPEAP